MSKTELSWPEEDWLQISGLQHYSFCPRQWALLHIEQQWAENLRTTEGELQHERAHEEGGAEKRGELLILRGLRVHSTRLGISGSCDVVEFQQVKEDDGAAGVPLLHWSGLWRPVPVEYKHGISKENDADRLQLCAQAMCLEEMLGACIPTGQLFYEQVRRRETVALTGSLRCKTEEMLAEMHRLFGEGRTPRSRTGPFCRACSVRELCLPRLCRPISGRQYLRTHLQEEPGPEGGGTQ